MANALRPLGSEPATEPELGPGPVPAGKLPQRASAPMRRSLEREWVNPRLNQAAERVGRTLGVAVGRARELPSRVAEARERFTVIRGKATEDATSKAADLKATARQRLYQGRSRAERLADEEPLSVIAGAAGIAFVLGFALRIWRSKNARS